MKFDVDDFEADKREKDLSSNLKADVDSCNSEDDKRKKDLSSNLKADVDNHDSEADKREESLSSNLSTDVDCHDSEADEREKNKSSDEKNDVNEEPRFDSSKYGDINDPNSDFDLEGYNSDFIKYIMEKNRLSQKNNNSLGLKPTENSSPQNSNPLGLKPTENSSPPDH